MRQKLAKSDAPPQNVPMLALATLLLSGPLVVIDPGHGGAEHGAKGSCGVPEKDVVLGIARELAAVLESSGYARAHLTRDRDVDVPLEARAALANELGAALFISIHANSSSNPRNAGVETFFLSLDSAQKQHRALVNRENRGRSLTAEMPKDPLDAVLKRLALEASHHESQRLALRLHDELARSTRYRARGVMQAPFIVLKGAQMAAALVEVGFLTHPQQCRRLASVEHQRAVARRLAGGIIAHLKSRAAEVALTR